MLRCEGNACGASAGADVGAGQVMLPERHRTKLSDVRLVAYHSSELEQRWLKSVNDWQGRVCDHTSEADVAAWLGALRQWWQEPWRMVYSTSTAHLPDELRRTKSFRGEKEGAVPA